MREQVDLWAGRLLLEWARLLQRAVASEDVWHRHQARRNRALYRADKYGMHLGVMAKRIGLSEDRVRTLIKLGGQPRDDTQPPT